MRRVIALSSQFAGKIGVVVDSKSLIDLGDKTTHEKIGVIHVDSNGFGVYYPERESRYLLVFKGASRILVDEVGNPDNWVDVIRYAIPEKPILHNISSYDVREDGNGLAIRLFWHTEKNNVKTWWTVEMDEGNTGTYQVVASGLLSNNVEVFVDKQETQYNFRVFGKNKVGQKGQYSNIISYTTGLIRQNNDTQPPISENPASRFSWSK